MVSAEKILEMNRLKSCVIEIPEWGNEKVLVKALPARQALQLSMKFAGKANVDLNPDSIADIVVACAFDPETGKKLFSTVHVKALLDEGTMMPLVMIMTKAQELSGFNDIATKQAALKN
jgi:hypothetical protein